LSLSLHFREAKDEQKARVVLEQIAVEANDAGLDARWGRKVLEIRPRLHADKGTAVASLLATAGAKRALYAGDDTTDRDAFRALSSVELLSGIKIAVDSAEAPAELLSEADLVVDGPGELARHLAQLSLRRSA
jgi:trehalose 6-phosphate phosphatase